MNLGATLCRKRTVSQRNTEAAQGATEKKPMVELIVRISSAVSNIKSCNLTAEDATVARSF